FNLTIHYILSSLNVIPDTLLRLLVKPEYRIVAEKSVEDPALGTFWTVPDHDTLDCLYMISYKASKKTLLLAGTTRYKAKD
ncbi:hypothetical protein BKA67DRAFT_528352, partial [Truncatella angustata]